MEIILKLTELAERLRSEGDTLRAEGVDMALNALGGDREENDQPLLTPDRDPVNQGHA